ncbi:MAG: hypothetical protein AAGI01_18240, partial [Myxococcota bacterium]
MRTIDGVDMPVVLQGAAVDWFANFQLFDASTVLTHAGYFARLQFKDPADSSLYWEFSPGLTSSAVGYFPVTRVSGPLYRALGLDFSISALIGLAKPEDGGVVVGMYEWLKHFQNYYVDMRIGNTIALVWLDDTTDYDADGFTNAEELVEYATSPFDPTMGPLLGQPTVELPVGEATNTRVVFAVSEAVSLGAGSFSVSCTQGAVSPSGTLSLEGAGEALVWTTSAALSGDCTFDIGQGVVSAGGRDNPAATRSAEGL